MGAKAKRIFLLRISASDDLYPNQVADLIGLGGNLAK